MVGWLPDLHRAARLVPFDADVFRARSDVYIAVDELQKALDDRTKCIELSPTDWKAHVERAHAFLVLCKFDEAMADIEKAGKLCCMQPADPSIAYCRALIRLTRDNGNRDNRRLPSETVNIDAALKDLNFILDVMKQNEATVTRSVTPAAVGSLVGNHFVVPQPPAPVDLRVLKPQFYVGVAHQSAKSYSSAFDAYSKVISLCQKVRPESWQAIKKSDPIASSALTWIIWSAQKQVDRVLLRMYADTYFNRAMCAEGLYKICNKLGIQISCTPKSNAHLNQMLIKSLSQDPANGYFKLVRITSAPLNCTRPTKRRNNVANASIKVCLSPPLSYPSHQCGSFN